MLKMVQIIQETASFHSDCYEDARALADIIEEQIPGLKGKIKIFWIGTTIGSHTGPGTVALFFRGDKKVD